MASTARSRSSGSVLCTARTTECRVSGKASPCGLEVMECSACRLTRSVRGHEPRNQNALSHASLAESAFCERCFLLIFCAHDSFGLHHHSERRGQYRAHPG